MNVLLVDDEKAFLPFYVVGQSPNRIILRIRPNACPNIKEMPDCRRDNIAYPYGKLHTLNIIQDIFILQYVLWITGNTLEILWMCLDNILGEKVVQR